MPQYRSPRPEQGARGLGSGLVSSCASRASGSEALDSGTQSSEVSSSHQTGGASPGALALRAQSSETTVPTPIPHPTPTGRGAAPVPTSYRRRQQAPFTRKQRQEEATD